MASPSTVLTLGYGSFGGAELLPTLGYGIAEAATPADGDRLRARDGGGRLAAPDRPARRRARDHDGRLRAK